METNAKAATAVSSQVQIVRQGWAAVVQPTRYRNRDIRLTVLTGSKGSRQTMNDPPGSALEDDLRSAALGSQVAVKARARCPPHSGGSREHGPDAVPRTS